MDKIARRFAGQGVGSIFLYTNEAHPGENYPHHTSFEQKLRHAAAFKENQGVERPILVDSLDGACHRRYGSMPNMTWIFSRVGAPVYKSDWTDARSAETALEYLLEVLDRRRSRARLAPFRVERLDFRDQDDEAFYAGLARSGPKAVSEFRAAMDAIRTK
jgi:hypothetical protein